MRRPMSWRRHMTKRKQTRWARRMDPPVLPMVLLGLIMREEFVNLLAAEEKRVLYGTGEGEPRGVIVCHPENVTQ